VFVYDLFSLALNSMDIKEENDRFMNGRLIGKKCERTGENEEEPDPICDCRDSKH